MLRKSETRVIFQQHIMMTCGKRRKKIFKNIRIFQNQKWQNSNTTNYSCISVNCSLPPKKMKNHGPRLNNPISFSGPLPKKAFFGCYLFFSVARPINFSCTYWNKLISRYISLFFPTCTFRKMTFCMQ